ncbi:MAG TPA: type II secretion system protein [Candidatus Saccharibacteria bacterium]|jgi:prepilin-type N-terminal cleavage/methylation domain-containing protein|nr:type II secretion system protein [Candidatus Saccharibacteria bacterium]
MLKLQKNLQAGFTIIELLIVIAIIGILATLVLTNFQGAQAKGRDTVRKNDINSIYQKLEEYYNENGGYPDGNLSTTVLAGIDAEALNDADGTAITYTGGFITSTTAPTLTPANTNEYIYAAYGCTTAGAQSTVGATCTKYVLASYLERETGNKYQKTSLN